MSVGVEWIVDAEGCDPCRLQDLDLLRLLCDAILRDLRLTAVSSPLWHPFPPPGGVTGLYLLTESHLACHTYPERGLATFNLYACGDRPAWPWEVRLRDVLRAERVRVQRVERGEGGG